MTVAQSTMAAYFLQLLQNHSRSGGQVDFEAVTEGIIMIPGVVHIFLADSSITAEGPVVAGQHGLIVTPHRSGDEQLSLGIAGMEIEGEDEETEVEGRSSTF